jgi:hypothetical protein
MTLIQRYREVKGYIFLSPRTNNGINFYTEIIERLRAKAGISWTWNVHDLRHGVRSEVRRLGEGLWSERFTAALNSNIEDEVAL